MSEAKVTRPKIDRAPSKTGRTYRGIRLPAMRAHSRFTPDQIRQAVEAAIAKNADAFARGT